MKLRTQAHVLAVVSALAALSSTTAFASGSERDQTSRREAAAPAVDAQAAIAAVRGAGYDGIRKLEWERGFWEARARDAQGRSVQVCVDGTSAAVTPCRK